MPRQIRCREAALDTGKQSNTTFQPALVPHHHPLPPPPPSPPSPPTSPPPPLLTPPASIQASQSANFCLQIRVTVGVTHNISDLDRPFNFSKSNSFQDFRTFEIGKYASKCSSNKTVIDSSTFLENATWQIVQKGTQKVSDKKKMFSKIKQDQSHQIPNLGRENKGFKP